MSATDKAHLQMVDREVRHAVPLKQSLRQKRFARVGCTGDQDNLGDEMFHFSTLLFTYHSQKACYLSKKHVIVRNTDERQLQD